MKKILLGLGLLLLSLHMAEAQTSRNPCYLNGQQSTQGIPSCESVSNTKPLPVTNTGSGGTVTITDALSNGPASVKPASAVPSISDPALVVSLSPNSAFTTVNQGLLAGSVANSWYVQPGTTPTPVSTPGCTIGTSSAQCLAGLTTAKWLQLQNTHATNDIACSWGGTAVLNAAGSFMLKAGQTLSWGFNSGGVPSQALNCIATVAATPLYVEYR